MAHYRILLSKFLCSVTNTHDNRDLGGKDNEQYTDKIPNEVNSFVELCNN